MVSHDGHLSTSPACVPATEKRGGSSLGVWRTEGMTPAASGLLQPQSGLRSQLAYDAKIGRTGPRRCLSVSKLNSLLRVEYCNERRAQGDAQGTARGACGWVPSAISCGSNVRCELNPQMPKIEESSVRLKGSSEK